MRTQHINEKGSMLVKPPLVIALLVLAWVMTASGLAPPALANQTLTVRPSVNVDLKPPAFQFAQPNSVCFDLEDMIPVSEKKTVVIFGAKLHRVTSAKVMMKRKSGGTYKTARGVYASLKSKQPNKLTVHVWADSKAKADINQMIYRLRVSWDKGRKILSGSILNIKVEKVCN